MILLGKSNTITRDKKSGRKGKGVYILCGVAVVLTIGFLILRGASGGGGSVRSSGDVVIAKGEITETARFIPYNVDGTKLEIVAIKASDGTVRTAFNTCQVCYSSGRGYYKQEGNELVCQNCGNRFAADQVEKIKGGCNPVPITSEYKKDDGTSIIIPRTTLEEAKGIFANWKQ